MRAFIAIVKLTLRNALRSHIFQLLLILLVLCVALVPTTVGGSTALDFIRVSLLYSLSGVGTLLSLSAMWLGCHVMSSDIDDYRLHMVVSKPVSRVTIWLGKFTGVLLLHLVLLSVAAAAIYGVVLWRFHHSDFSEAERERIKLEVLVGRRVFMPERRDYEKLAREELRKRITRMGRSVSPRQQDRIFKECLKQLIAEDSEVQFGPEHPREWVFKNVPPDAKRALYLRYRPYVGKVRSEDQRETAVQLFVWLPKSFARPESGGEPTGAEDRFPVLIPHKPILMAGEFHELPLRGDIGIVSPKGEVRVAVVNLDPKQDKQFYQPADGPKLLLEVTTFLGNYARAILVLMLQLAMMTALSCAFGGFLTLPTAVFVSMSYLVFGFMASFMTDPGYYVSSEMDKAGQSISQWVLGVVVPLERFDVTDLVAGGELVEWSLIWNIAWSCLLLRTLPWVLGGLYLYWRREIGLEIKK